MTSTIETIGQSGSHNTHARLSPSDAGRWAHCTMSISVTADIPKESSTFSDAGTEAHDWCEKVLTDKSTIDEVPEDIRPYVKIYVDHCHSITPPNTKPLIEVQVPLFYSPSDKGTCDFAVVTPDRVWVRDYKHGAGVYVDVVENDQLAIYALSIVEDNMWIYEFDPATIIDIGIVQPRYRGGEEIRTWVLTLSDLRLFCRDIEYAAIQIQEGRGLKYEVGEKICKWCPRAWKVKCPARVKMLAESADVPSADGFDFLSALPDLSKEDTKKPPEEKIEIRHAVATGAIGEPLSDEILLKLWKNRKNIIAFLEDIHEDISARVVAGETFGGECKVVMGQCGNRAWADEDSADKFLKHQGLKQDERYDFKLKGPAKIEVMLKDKLTKTRTKNLFESHITRSAPKPVAALIDDKRPAISSALDSLPSLESDPDFD